MPEPRPSHKHFLPAGLTAEAAYSLGYKHGFGDADEDWKTWLYNMVDVCPAARPMAGDVDA